MPSQNATKTVANYALKTQSILDVFVVQGIVTPQDAEVLKRQYRTNELLERVLLKNHIASRETINKAYSILLKLPFVSLKNLKIDKNALNLISPKTSKRFRVVVFGILRNSIKIAVARPSELSAGLPLILDKISKNRGYKIDLYITGEEDFKEAYMQYNTVGETKLVKNSYPVIFLRNQNINIEDLSKIPLEFVKKNRIAVFRRRSDTAYDVATEKPNDPQTINIIRGIEQSNKINLQIFATSKEDIDYLIKIHPENKNDNKLGTNSPTPLVGQKEMATDSQDEIVSLGDIFSSIVGNKNNQKKDSSAEITIESREADHASSENGRDKDHSDEEDFLKTSKARDNALKQEAETLKDNLDELNQKDNVIVEDRESKKLESENTKDEEDIGSLLKVEIDDRNELIKVIKENYIPKTVAAVIMLALNMRASDIHVEASDKNLRIRYRVDGILRDIVRLPLNLQPPIISRIKILARLKLDETRIPQDGRFTVKFRNHEVDVRTSSLPTVHGEKIVMRILDKKQTILSLEDLGMEGRAFNLSAEAVAKPYGIILSTGPTGSGKSTTLYAIINRVSVPSVNIVTLEDPVEYEIPGVNQCQIKPGIGFTFAEGLRSVLRQDPNVVMVGEIRDAETANMATHAALTGHLVLSTLHTNDAAGALPRLINMGVEPFLITSSINLIIAQRLIRRICPKCKREMNVPKSLMDSIVSELKTIPQNNQVDRKRIPAEIKFYHGVGCADCAQGYKGRVGLFEVLKITPEIEDLAVKKMPANDIKAAAIRDGMITIKQDGILKALAGITTVDEVFRATSS